MQVSLAFKDLTGAWNDFYKVRENRLLLRADSIRHVAFVLFIVQRVALLITIWIVSSWAWWRAPVIPATPEAETGELLEPGRRRLQ